MRWTAGVGLWAAAWVSRGRLQGDGDAVPHEPGGRHDVGGVEMVQRAVLVPLAPAAPGTDGVEQRAELAGADLHPPAAVVLVMA